MSGFEEVAIDQVRDFWNRRPCNIRHSPQPVGTRAYFDEVEARKYFVEPHIPGFAEFSRWAGKRVLEIGCGIGTDTINFARAGAEVTAIELSEESLALARRRAEVYKVEDRIEFRHGNAEELDRLHLEGGYDLVYSFGVIHHTPHPERVLEHARALARPGGTLKMMVYNRRSWKAAQIAIGEGHGRFWRMTELLSKHSEAQVGSPVTYSYSRRELVALLERHGFPGAQVAVEHIFPYRVADYLQYRYVKVPLFRVMPEQLFRWFERHAGWHLCATATTD
jgi:2-polyprenyl-3-methyl-5-hydroxy-6-metoxy-1,4-benzoquinol methylase